MSKKSLLAHFLYHSGFLRGAASFREKGIVVITYHRIRPAGFPIPDGLDENVFGPDQSDFERQVKWLKQNLTVLSESELLEVIQNSRVKEPCAVITFDDGYRDNYELAYPVLRAHRAPAIFFVCPGLMDKRWLGWWDIIAGMVKKSKQRVITLRGEVLRLGDEKERVIGLLQSWMKSRPSAETAGLLEELSDACGVAFPDRQFQDGQLMTWEQVAEVNRNGVAIGSHTQMHRVLATLDEEEQRWELRESKAALEGRLGRPVQTIAYPAGSYRNFTPATMRIARECGYEAGFSFHSGGNFLPGVNPYDLHRIPATISLDAMFACSAFLPSAFSWVQPMPEAHRAFSSQPTAVS
jgi:peptidoglycan/xylan/chitin deacetylase (PgdA/CDA1 family)